VIGRRVPLGGTPKPAGEFVAPGGVAELHAAIGSEVPRQPQMGGIDDHFPLVGHVEDVIPHRLDK
jgi:hypothetical protein